MQEGTLGDSGGPPNGPPNPWTYKNKRFKAAAAAVSIVTLFALTAVLGTADGVWAQTCAGNLHLVESPVGPYQIGDTVTLTATILNTGSTPAVPQVVTNYVQKLSCPANVTDFALCTSPDDTSVLFENNIKTTCVDSMSNPIVWTPTLATGQVTFTPTKTLTLADGASCTLSFDEKINALGSSSTPPHSIDWASRYNGICQEGGGDTLTGKANGSGEFIVIACSVEVDKQVSCDGGKTFFDVSGVDDTEPPSKTLSSMCIGFNAFGANPPTNIIVRYKARNTGTADATCSTTNMLGLTDTNLGILPAGV